MVRRTVSVLAAGAVLRLATVAPASFLTAPQRDSLVDAFTSPSADVSADGRFIAFESQARLVPADTNDRRDIYVLDLETREVTLESAAPGGRGDAVRPRLSGDGRFLVFESTPAASSSGFSQIVLSDRLTATATIASAGSAGAPANGSSHDPDISNDGRVVAFASDATNLIAGEDANGRGEDVYVCDVRSRTFQRISVDSAGVQPPAGVSRSPSVSGDGLWVAFVSSAPLVPPAARPGRGRTPGESRQVYVRDLAGRTTIRVSTGKGAAPSDRDSWGPAINRDGRFVAFVSAATNLGSGGGNDTADVFLKDLGTGTMTLVSRTADGEAGSGNSLSPSISGDGRLVAFHSDAPNLVCVKRCPPGDEDINLLSDVFLFDRQSTTTARVSRDESAGWMEASRGPALDASGRVLAFASRHPIDPLDRGDDFDLFVKMEPIAEDGRGLATPPRHPNE